MSGMEGVGSPEEVTGIQLVYIRMSCAPAWH